jgi:hypothetical protein
VRRRKAAYLLIPLFLVVLAAALYFPYSNRIKQAGKDFNSRASTPITTFTPAIINRDDLSQQEIINAGRGYYKWNGGEVVPLNNGQHLNSSYDVYQRLTWDSLESDTTPGDYSKGFALIEAKAAEAKQRGGKFSFAVYALCQGCDNPEAVPQYISGNKSTYSGWNADGLYIPDWNNQNFLNRARSLLNALGGRFNNDPRIDYLDIRIYGQWGEWHMYDFKDRFPNGITDITLDNKKAIIDMHISAFSNKRLVMMLDEEGTAYSLTKSTNAGRIGWRGDCLGLNGSGNNGVEHFRRISNFENVRPAWEPIWNGGLKDLWKVAPAVTELCPARSGKSTPAGLQEPDAAIAQVKDYHVALVGNGNMNTNQNDNETKWAAFTSTEQNKYRLLGRNAGYRYAVKDFSIPSEIPINGGFAFTTNWLNNGSAPTYDNWNIMVQLRNPANSQLVWETKSSVNLKNVLSSESGQITINDLGSLGGAVPVGEYDVTIMSKDPTGYYTVPYNLRFANTAYTNGYLPLGKVRVVNVLSTITPTVTTEPTVTTTVSPTVTVTSTVSPTTTVNPTTTINPTVTVTTTPTSTTTPTITVSPTATTNPTVTSTPLPTSTASPTSTTNPTITSSPVPTTVPPTTTPVTGLPNTATDEKTSLLFMSGGMSIVLGWIVWRRLKKGL